LYYVIRDCRAILKRKAAFTQEFEGNHTYRLAHESFEKYQFPYSPRRNNQTRKQTEAYKYRLFKNFLKLFPAALNTHLAPVNYDITNNCSQFFISVQGLKNS
jgi:hypothetical protein